MTDLERNLERKINDLLGIFPVVLILGARQVGKTTLAQHCRPQWKYFDLEKGSDFDFISHDFDFFFREYPQQIIFDEAQELPQLFRELRGVIDANRKLKNRFILTGSSSPDILTQAADSLAGRIGIVEVGTMKVNELIQQPLPTFYEIFNQQLSAQTLGFLKEQPINEADFLDYFLTGTYPEPVLNDNKKTYDAWMENYYQTYINRDIKKFFPKLDAIKYRRFIAMLAGLSGTIINKAQLGRALDISEVTARDYLEIADKTLIWRSIPSYESSTIKSTTKMPKGIFRDAGLLHFLSHIHSRETMLTHPNVGYNFESFVIEEVIKGIQATDTPNWNYFYYRTRNGAEIDLILEGRFGVLPIEIKFGMSTSLKQLTSLNKFIKENKIPFGIVINNSIEIKMLSDKIIQLPINVI